MAEVFYSATPQQRQQPTVHYSTLCITPETPQPGARGDAPRAGHRHGLCLFTSTVAQAPPLVLLSNGAHSRPFIPFSFLPTAGLLAVSESPEFAQNQLALPLITSFRPSLSWLYQNTRTRTAVSYWLLTANGLAGCTRSLLTVRSDPIFADTLLLIYF